MYQMQPLQKAIDVKYHGMVIPAYEIIERSKVYLILAWDENPSAVRIVISWDYAPLLPGSIIKISVETGMGQWVRVLGTKTTRYAGKNKTLREAADFGRLKGLR